MGLGPGPRDSGQDGLAVLLSRSPQRRQRWGRSRRSGQLISALNNAGARTRRPMTRERIPGAWPTSSANLASSPSPPPAWAPRRVNALATKLLPTDLEASLRFVFDADAEVSVVLPAEGDGGGQRPDYASIARHLADVAAGLTSSGASGAPSGAHVVVQPAVAGAAAEEPAAGRLGPPHVVVSDVRGSVAIEDGASAEGRCGCGLRSGAALGLGAGRCALQHAWSAARPKRKGQRALARCATLSTALRPPATLSVGCACLALVSNGGAGRLSVHAAPTCASSRGGGCMRWCWEQLGSSSWGGPRSQRVTPRRRGWVTATTGGWQPRRGDGEAGRQGCAAVPASCKLEPLGLVSVAAAAGEQRQGASWRLFESDAKALPSNPKGVGTLVHVVLRYAALCCVLLYYAT